MICRMYFLFCVTKQIIVSYIHTEIRKRPIPLAGYGYQYDRHGGNRSVRDHVYCRGVYERASEHCGVAGGCGACICRWNGMGRDGRQMAGGRRELCIPSKTVRRKKRRQADVIPVHLADNIAGTPCNCKWSYRLL